MNENTQNQQRGNCPCDNVQGVWTGKLSPKCAAKLPVSGAVLRMNERYHRFQWQQPLQLVSDLLSHHYIRAFYCAGPPSFLIPASKEASGPKNLGIHLGQQLRLSFNPRIVSTCTTLSNSNHCILFSINHVRRTSVEQLKLIPTMHLTQANTSACSQYLLSH